MYHPFFDYILHQKVKICKYLQVIERTDKKFESNNDSSVPKMWTVPTSQWCSKNRA